MPPALRTDRLLLRKPVVEDLTPFTAMFSDPEVVRYIGDGTPRSPERVERGFRNGLLCWDRLGFGPFTVLHNDLVIGDCLLYPIARSGTDPTDFAARGPEIELAYRLAREAWGQGFATEAARAALDWAMSDTGPALSRLIAVTHPDNTASQRVLEKLGMRSLGDTNAYYDTPTTLFETTRD